MLPARARTGPSRRTVLLGAAAALAPFAGFAADVCTPRDLAVHYRASVAQRLHVPHSEARLYASLAEANFFDHPEPPWAPQYMLVVDCCPSVQAAFVYWRLMAGQWDLVGASPASTGCSARAGHLPTPVGVFAREAAGRAPARAAARAYDFGVQRARKPGGGFVPLRLQARAATGAARAFLGKPQSDGCVLLPASMMAFLDLHGVLDGAAGEQARRQAEPLPFAGRYLVVVDSEREERPEWAVAAS